MTIKFDNWAEKGDIVIFPDYQFVIDEIIHCEYNWAGWHIEYIDYNGHHRTWNQYRDGGALIQYHTKKRYVTCDGRDVTDIFEKYGY